MSFFEQSCCVFRWVLQFENQGIVTLVIFLAFWFWNVNLFLTFLAQPLQIRLFIDCVILISMGWTPLCRCYSSSPPPVNSGFNLNSFDLFTYAMCNVSGFLPLLCFPSCIHWMRSCCFTVVFTSCFCSLGHACLILCSLVMNFLQFAYSCLTFCCIITQIAFGVRFSWNIWIKITVLVIQENMGSGVVVLYFVKFS